MKITHLKTNHVENPLGYAIERPSFSWIVEDTVDTVQTAAQVIVSRDSGFQEIVFDSGKVARAGIDSLAYRPAIALAPRTRYFWKARVWGETESAESDAAWFETGKMDEDWQAEWITPDTEGNQLHPILYREFEVPARVASARVYICGLGLYRLELNGEKVGDEVFTPYLNAYDQWIQYQTFDITGQVVAGSNLVSVMLGNGWYKGRYGADGGVVGFYGDRFALICELHITLESGERMIIPSDAAWEAQPSPVVHSDIFDGEMIDARIGLVTPSVGKSFGVRPIGIDTGLLEARRSLPARIIEEIKPVEVIETPAGETVLDFGQIMTGWVRFRTNAPMGTRIHLLFGEVMQGGNFFRDNLRSAKAEFTYIADGTDAVVEPYFTFFGFRYVKVEGWVGAIDITDFSGCVVHSQMDVIGEIETSNPKVNQLIKNAMWSQKGNFLDIPSDCPQRDERLGWTGDIQVFSGTACFNMDVAAFLSKYAYDLGIEQAKSNGLVPHIVPMVNLNKGASTAWGDVATILPWNLYQFYGDVAILEQQFESMRGWVEYIRRIDDASGGRRLWTEGKHFGDWLSLDAPDPVSRRGGTPHDFIASAFYCYSAGLTAKAARVLGKAEEADAYERLAGEIRAAIREEYFTSTGRLAVATQTAYVLALFIGLVPEEHRERVEKDLIERLHKDKAHLKTGFVGTPYLCRVLSNIGANDLAYKLVLNEDFPSWLYAINLGATTIWERWNSLNPDGSISSTGMNSFNHYAYGSIVEWMYRDMCGLNPYADDESMTGFRRALIAPKPDKSLGWARARYRAAAGVYESGWRIDDAGKLTIVIAIPFNASARVVLPDARIGEVSMNGVALADAEEIGGNVELTLGAGRYEFAYLAAGKGYSEYVPVQVEDKP